MPCAPDTATASSVQVERSLELRLSSAAASAAATEVVRGQSLHLGLAEHHQRVQRSELNARLLLELNRQSGQDGPASGATSAAGAGVGSSSSNNANMATATKPELRRKFPPPPTPAETDSGAGDEDIAAIAKQISDHAEAIYQTWKSRGLAPTEILNCHSNAIAADKFGTVLTPTSNGGIGGAPTPQRRPSPVQSSCSPVELLAQDNNNLEKLVNNFVVEDKARIAASRQRSPSKTMPSSIQFALQKFEQNSASSPKTPTQLKSPLGGAGAPFVNRPSSQIAKTLASIKSPVNSHHNEIFLETIDTPFTGEVTPSKIAAAQQHVKPRPTQLGGVVSPSPPLVDSWPLKNKIVNDSRKPAGVQILRSPAGVSPGDSLATRNSSRSPESNSNDASYLDEVAREEERLINALKTGAVISEEPSVCLERIIPVQVTPSTTASTPTVSTTPTTPTANQQLPVKQKPAIIREKPKVEPVKPILISPNQVSSLNSNGIIVPNNVLASPNGCETKGLSKDELSSLSTVDYAKARYRVAQQSPPTQQRFDEQKNNAKPVIIDQPIVATARSKFEPELTKTTVPEKGSKVDDKVSSDGKDGVKDTSKDEKDFIASRWGLRLNSPRPRPVEPLPHPELTTQQKQHIRAAAATNTGNNPVRPFLTRGSVAERVLIFEKCPSELLLDKRGPRQPASSAWRTTQEVNNKTQPCTKEKTQPKSLPPHTTLQRHVKANRNVHIPRFYFPGGKPTPLSQIEATISRITAAFQSLPGHRASRSQFHTITKACDLPLYWKIPLFLASGGDTNGIIEMSEFLDFWKELCDSHHDAASKFVRVVTKGQRTAILPEDLIPLVQDVVESHPGLTFLKEATEFHSRYVHTVIARIFYCVNRSWSGKISVPELRRSNLLSVIQVLEHKEDINQVTAYFSYEHFYVIYCKFWELDRDHDLFIDKMDLTRHNDHALSTRMIERIFSGAVTRGVKSANGVQHPQDKMSYTEFVWFLLSEEDKNHPTAIEYWFRCMDLDGDGYLSMYELEYFYEEQLHRMEAIGIETLPYEDCLCQMLDMIKPEIPGKISLSDLKKCKMTSIFFDTFFNLEKYLDHEQRDPFASARDHDADGHELSDWDRFAAEEYELLVAEESGNDQNDQSPYDEDAYSPNLDLMIDESMEVVGSAHQHHQNQQQQKQQQQLDPRSPASQGFFGDRRGSTGSYYDSCDSDDYADSDN